MLILDGANLLDCNCGHVLLLFQRVWMSEVVLST